MKQSKFTLLIQRFRLFFFRFDGEQPSNMAVIELKLVSGFTVDEDHVYSVSIEQSVSVVTDQLKSRASLRGGGVSVNFGSGVVNKKGSSGYSWLR